MRTKILQSLLLLAAVSSSVAHAQNVGRVLLAAGDVAAVRGTAVVKLTPGAVVQEKDMLRTGAASNLQVRFSDDGLVSLRENSELRIDEFRYSGKADGAERAFFSLLKGGLRAFTGVVGRRNNDDYRMSTNTALIGIRGTDYVLALCQQGSCRNNDGSAARDGLYGRPQGPSHGTNRVDVRNEREQKQFGINDTFFVADSKSTIDTLIAPPNFLSGKLEGRAHGTAVADAGQSGGTDGTQQDSRIAPVPPLATGLTFVAPETAAGGTAPYSPLVLPPPLVIATPTIGLVTAFSSNGPNFTSENGATFVAPSMLTLNGTGDLVGLNIPAGTLTANGTTLGITGSTSLTPDDLGGEPSINARWGRWPSGAVATDGGSLVSNIPGGAHFLFGDLTPAEVVAAKSGTFNSLNFGGTVPTDSAGNVGVDSSYPNITFNFTSRTVNVSVFNWYFGESVWNLASTNGTINIVSGKGATITANGTGTRTDFSAGTSSTGASYNISGIFLGAQGNYLGVSIGMRTNTNSVSSAQGVRLYNLHTPCTTAC